ncbi:MAG: serine hydrolase domain-containing protein, partial [Acidobacteriota bacterium]
MEIHGTVAPGFEPAARAFRENFERRGEVGASFCAYHRGEPVVDLWSGVADVEHGRPWLADTLCVIFSATKGLAAAAVLGAVHRGLLDYDAPVAGVWPELARGRLADLTLRQVMNHRSGLVTVDSPISLDELADPEGLAPLLARQTPEWTPGDRQGYHGVTYGLYVSEIFRRAVGRTLGQWLRDEVTGPLGADAFLGLPPAEDSRVASL